MRPKPEARSPKPGNAYVTALALLARRELSERQLRERLARRGFDEGDIDAAVARLKADGSLDDARVAAAIARSQTGLKRRGRVRVRQAIASAGIDGETARHAMDAVFADVDDEALIQGALARRLKDDRPIADDREFQRLYRYLVGQGFESDRVLKLLSARRGRR